MNPADRKDELEEQWAFLDLMTDQQARLLSRPRPTPEGEDEIPEADDRTISLALRAAQEENSMLQQEISSLRRRLIQLESQTRIASMPSQGELQTRWWPSLFR